jgi:ubiquinone biosynthesis protein COQ9
MNDILEKHQQTKNSLFEHLLILLKEDCLSYELINKAEQKAKIAAGYHELLFPGGIREIAISLEGWLDNKMLEELAKIPAPGKIRHKIAKALEIRIMGLANKKAIFNMSSFYLLPEYITLGAKADWNTCNIMWRYAGDQSADFNYYTKRSLLLGVYVSATAFYFADNSENHQDTKNFIDNALDNIINIASFKSKIKLPKKEDIPIIRLFS